MTNTGWDDQGQARAALNSIVSDPQYGIPALSSAQTMSNLLKDLLPDAPRQSSVLVAAAEAGVPGTLQGYLAQGMDAATATRLTSAALAARTPFTQDACDWVVGELAQVLGVSPAAPAAPAAPVTPAGSQPPTVAAGLPPQGASSDPAAAGYPGGATVPPAAAAGYAGLAATAGPGGYPGTPGQPPAGAGGYPAAPGQPPAYPEAAGGYQGPPAGYQGGPAQPPSPAGYPAAVGGAGTAPAAWSGPGQPAPRGKIPRGAWIAGVAVLAAAVAVILVLVLNKGNGKPQPASLGTGSASASASASPTASPTPTVSPTPTPSSTASLSPQALALKAIMPTGVFHCKQVPNHFHRVNLTGAVWLACGATGNGGTTFSVQGLQFDSAADYTAGVAKLNDVGWNHVKRTAHLGCPPVGGVAGINTWHSPTYPSRHGQILECFPNNKGQPIYLWTLPSKQVVFLAGFNSAETFTGLQRWWHVHG